MPQPFKYVGQFGVMAEPNGFYYMRARYYDPKVGRFVSEDPLGFGGGDVNLSNYVGGNPVMRVDPLGLKPGDPYLTIDAAGINAISDINSTSISRNLEYGGYVYQNPNGSYSYTAPVAGSPAGLTTLGPKPTTGTVVGDYHTHGAYDKKYDNENFSTTDKNDNIANNTVGYLGTPNNAIKK